MANFGERAVPTAAELNELAGGTIEVFADAEARTLAMPAPELGQLTWIISAHALDLWAGNEWVELANVVERTSIKPTNLAIPEVPFWLSSTASLTQVTHAVNTNLGGICGGHNKSPQPRIGGALFWSLSGNDVAAWAGDDAVGLIDDAAQRPYYPLSEPSLAAVPNINSDVNLGGVTFQRDGNHVTLIMVGVCSWRVHLAARAQIIIVGSGGRGGASGTLILPGSRQISAVGGGGGGAGGVVSAMMDLVPGQILTARTGGRISRQILSDNNNSDTNFVTPKTLGAEHGGDIITRDGVSVEAAGSSSACWIDGRPVGQAGGGSAGNTNPGVRLGEGMRPAGYALGGASQGGGAALSGHITAYPVTADLPDGMSNRGGNGGQINATGQDHILASGGGGGGAKTIGGDGETITYTTNLGQYATSGSGGEGINLGWLGVPNIASGGAGGWAAGYVAAELVPPAQGVNYGYGATGGHIYYSSSVSGYSGGQHLISSHLPGLGVVLIRYRLDGLPVAETLL